MPASGLVKWGIIGCGNIAGKFAHDLLLVPGTEITAVASRITGKARDFAKTYGAKSSYGSYDALLADPQVDIVYIATPHTFHAEWSIKAMEAGKHVLCEKPSALNRKETLAIVQTAKRTGKFFMEALWTRFNPVFVEVKRLADNGAIGKLQYINADFTFKADKPLSSRVFDLKLGGGAILDIGIYPVFLTYALLGKPKAVKAKSVFHPVAGCDMQTAMIFEYPDAMASLFCSFTTNSGITARIGGTEGQITVAHPFHAATSFTLIKDGKSQQFEIPLKGNGFYYEIEACNKAVRTGTIEDKHWSHQNSIDLIELLDRIRAEVNLVYPAE